MCGRYTYVDADGVLRVIFGYTQKSKMRPVTREPWVSPRYNAAIGQAHPIIMNNGEAALGKWGLVPSWSATPSVTFDTFNAKAETLTEKKVFAPLLRYRRCLVPADGMIEFEKKGKLRIPYYVRMKSRRVFCFAGLWDLWGDEMLSYTIITTTPNTVVGAFHHRMGAILEERDCAAWLKSGDLGVLKPYRAEEMEAVAISPLVNSVGNDFPGVLEAPALPVVREEKPPAQGALF